MKKANLKVFSLLIVFVAMLGLLFGQVTMGMQCFAQDQAQQSVAAQTKVVVTGSCKQEFDADSACVNVQVETLDLDKNVSKEKNKELLQKVILVHLNFFQACPFQAFPTEPNSSIFSLTVALIASKPGARSFLGSKPLPCWSLPASMYFLVASAKAS